MKKILLLLITILSIVVIYVLNVDKKVYVFSIGDSFAIGKTDLSQNIKSYDDTLKQYLEEQNKLEKYITNYQTPGLRINDVINDINANKKIDHKDKKYNIKNILIKSDLVTISINNDDLLNRLSNYYSIQELYEWVDELAIEYENLLNIIRDYCKEKVIVIGYYYQSNLKNDNEIVNLISYLNSELYNISQIYKVDYINTSDLLLDDIYIGEQSPIASCHRAIGKEIINILNKHD